MRIRWIGLLCTLCPLWASAQVTPAERARTIAPYIDAQTLVVAYIDTGRLDLNALESVAKSFVDAPDAKEDITKSLAQARKEASQWLTAFAKAGGKDVYITFSLADLPEPMPLIIAPVNEQSDVKTIGRLLSTGAAEPSTRPAEANGPSFERIGSAVVAGKPAALARVRQIKPAERPEITKAFEAAGIDSVQIVIVPNADTRRVIEETFTELPAKVGGGPITAITHGFLWAAIGIEAKPAVSVRMVIQSQDAAAAKAFAETIDRMLQAVKQEKTAHEVLPAIDELARVLKPTVRDDRLMVELNNDTLQSVIGHKLAAPLGQARERARLSASMNQIKQLLMGCILYTVDHKNEWPADLESVANSKELNAPMLLVNPRQPERKVGYSYLRPAKMPSDASQSVIIYETFDTWPAGGIAVGYADGHVELVKDKARFDEQRARNEPSPAK